MWASLARTVTPLAGEVMAHPPLRAQPVVASAPARPARAIPPVSAPPPPPPGPRHPAGAHGLDSGWDRKLARGLADPDFTLDLHGCTLDAAHGRLLHGLAQARAMGARLVLLVTGRPRPVEAADRGEKRGAIRSKVVDWLAASDLAHDIAAIRGAHRRHGGQGALYIVLKRRR